MTAEFRVVFSVEHCHFDLRLVHLKVLNNDVDKFRVFCCRHVENLRGSKDLDLVTGTSISLSVGKLTENSFNSCNIDKSKTNCRRNAAGLAYSTDDFIVAIASRGTSGSRTRSAASLGS